MKRNQMIRTVLYVLAAALLCLPAAMWVEGFGLQHQLLLTPGMMLSNKFFPPDQSLRTLRQSIILEVSLDWALCFILLCTLFLALMRLRRLSNESR
jgi:hypothetical protein